MQNAGFKHINFDAIYEKFHLVDGNSLKNEFIKNEFSGANITVPHKRKSFFTSRCCERNCSKNRSCKYLRFTKEIKLLLTIRMHLDF